MMATTLRAKLDAGQTVLGLFTPQASPTQAELLAMSGFDFLICDGEHGEIAPADMTSLALACEAHDCAPLIRVPSIESRVVGRFLDYGAAGVIAPMINSIADGERLLQSALYPPEGSRGLAQTRNTGYGLRGDIADQLAQSNTSTLAIVQIETQEAIDHLDEILSLDRVDIVFVGPADLSSSLGIPMQFTHPKFLEAMMNIATKVKASGKHLGGLIADAEQIPMLHSLGFRFIAVYMDMLLAAACHRFVTDCRSGVSSAAV